MSCDAVLGDRSLVPGDPVARVHADLPTGRMAVGVARVIVTSALTRGMTPLSDEMVWTAQLLTDELVTNAVRYAGADLHLGLVHDDRTLLIAVADAHPDVPPQRPAAAVDYEDAARGMTIVAGFADDFGWRYLADPAHKSMWALLALDSASDVRHPAP